MSEDKTTNKPDWLLTLEQESWQAELTISGIIIFGLSQIPSYFLLFMDWLVTVLPIDASFWGYMFSILILGAIDCLIVVFVFHFILRSIWIGLIGFNSVYPNGPKFKSELYSPYYMDKVKNAIGTFKIDIQKMDNLCSTLFIMAACGGWVIVSMSFIMPILYGVNKLLTYLIPSLASIIPYFMGLLFILYYGFILYALSEKGKKNNKAQDILFKLSNTVSLPMMTFFYKPITYIFTSIGENGKSKKSIIYVWIISSTIPLFILAFHLSDSSITYLINPESMYRSFSRSDRSFNNYYEDQIIEKDLPIFTAMIEKEHISKGLMKVFVPIFRNENTQIAESCGTYEELENITKEEEHKNYWHFWSDCYQNYHQFYVNDRLYEVEIVKTDHPHRSTKGIVTYIPTDGFKLGKNVLKVEKKHPDSTNSYRVMRVPFWFSED